MPSMVVARDRLEMAGRTSALEPRSGLASRVPGLAIGFRPQVQRQRTDLALSMAETFSDTVVTEIISFAQLMARI